MDLSMAGIKSTAAKMEVPLGVLGFTIGVTGEDILYAQQTGLWDSYDIDGKAKLVIGKLIARTTGIKVLPDYVGDTSFSFNPFGWINKGFALALGAWVYREIGLPYSTLVKNVVYPLGVGWAIGGVFDPPLGRSAPSGGAQASNSRTTGGFW